MKKRERRLMMTLLCAFALGAWLSPLHADTGPQKRAARAGGGYEVLTPLIGDPAQLSTNSTSYYPLANLVDGNTGTAFESVWLTEMADPKMTEERWIELLAEELPDVDQPDSVNNDPGWHNLQVNVETPVQRFCFEYNSQVSGDGYNDNPNHILILATNDDRLGGRTTNADQDQWDVITELTTENTDFPGDVQITDKDNPWRSQVIEMGKAYKYIRFVVKGTTHMGKVDLRRFFAPEVTGVTFNMSEFQVYSARVADGPGEVLLLLADSVDRLWAGDVFEPGDDPGYADTAKYRTAAELLEAARAAAYEEHSDEEYADWAARLRAAVGDFMTSGIRPIEAGYYNFVNGFANYQTQQGVTKSMCVDAEKRMAWETTDSLSVTQLWIVDTLDGGWSIQNASSKQYVSTAGQSEHVPMTDTPENVQVFTRLRGGPRFVIHAVGGQPYHTEGHSGGAGRNGLIVPYPVNEEGNDGSSWYIRKVDKALADSLLGNASAAGVKLALDSAEASRAKADRLPPLIYSSGQLSANSRGTAGGDVFSRLIDGDVNTAFESVWDASMNGTTFDEEQWRAFLATHIDGVNNDPGWHNLQVRLRQPVRRFFFEYNSQVSSGGYNDNPNHILILATNDEALGGRTANADQGQWTEIAELTTENTDFPGDVQITDKDRPWRSQTIDMQQEYRYVRFVIMGTTHEKARGFASPEVTGVTWNLSEFQMYDADDSLKSEYNTVPGMKAACDALDAAMEDAKGKLAAGSAGEADIASLQAAYRLVDSAYVDRRPLYDEMRTLLRTGRDLLGASTGEGAPLISDASQFSSNSYDGTASREGLLDDDDYTVFHSVWIRDLMESETTTKEEWEERVASVYPPSEGAGYHNLQVRLPDPVSGFRFEYYGVTSASFHDNPTDIAIYATNDEELYGDVRDATTPDWNFVKELNEGFPTGVATESPYVSPEITLEKPYKYFRFVIKATCLSQDPTCTARHFANPDITGITWNLSKFQMYATRVDGAQSSYVPEVEAAAGALRAALEKFGGYTESDISSKDAIDELRDAVEGLRDSRVDTSEVVRLYNSYKSLAESALNGDAGGDVAGSIDSYDAADDFDALLDEARAGIDPKKPTKAEVSGALDKINQGYEEFMSHVTLPEPYVWYVIRSAATGDVDRERLYVVDTVGGGQPAYLKEFSTGDMIAIDSLDSGGKLSDVSALWRLVPAGPEDESAKPWERKYAIQSLATGQYWGPYNGAGYPILMSHRRIPYVLNFNGSGSFKIRQDSIDDPDMCAEPSSRANCGVFNNGWNSEWDNGNLQGWRFERAEDVSSVLQGQFPAESTIILTLPWAVTGDSPIAGPGGEDVKTYTVNRVDTVPDGGGYALSLTEKDEFEAGEPFIIETPAAEAEDDSTGLCRLQFTLPPAEADAVTDTSAIVANGLVGTLEGFDIQGMANLYFENSTLYVGTESVRFIPGRSGYISVMNVKDLGDKTDATFTMYGTVNRIEDAAAEGAGSDAAVDVYTVDGVLLKRGVRASEAAEGLGRGVYIIGRKKVLVR